MINTKTNNTIWLQKRDQVNFNHITIPKKEDKNCQPKMFSDKDCQEKQNANTWPVQPEVEKSSNQWLSKPAVPYKYKSLCNDKNCQSTRCYKKKSSVRPVHGYNKNCQEVQSVYMWPKKPISNMWSMTKTSVMWLPKPAMVYKVQVESIQQELSV